MGRTVNASTITALESDNFRMAHLVKIEFTSPILFTDYFHDIVDGSDTYQATGHPLAMASPKETRELRVNTISLTVSAVDQAYVSIFLSSDWINRRVLVQKAVIDTSGSIIGDAIVVFDGLLSQFQINEDDKTSSLTMNVASHWADFERKAGRLTNNNSQQYWFSGDLGMEYAANSVKDIKWGRS